VSIPHGIVVITGRGIGMLTAIDMVMMTGMERRGLTGSTAVVMMMGTIRMIQGDMEEDTTSPKRSTLALAAMATSKRFDLMDMVSIHLPAGTTTHIIMSLHATIINTGMKSRLAMEMTSATTQESGCQGAMSRALSITVIIWEITVTAQDTTTITLTALNIAQAAPDTPRPPASASTKKSAHSAIATALKPAHSSTASPPS